MVRRPRRLRQHADAIDRRPARALEEVAAEGASVVVLGLEELGEECWAVLTDAGVRVMRVADVAGVLAALREQVAQVVLAEARRGRELTATVRGRRELASTHIVLCAALDSPAELRGALDAGGDDVMRVPFAPEVLAARVAAGLRAARLRANEALLHSLVANIPGAVYRCACDEHWTMEWLSDEIEKISGYPASDFINSAVRTFASVIDPDDREQVERSVMDAVDAGRPFELEYRIRRRDGGVRWVLERGQAQEAGDGRRWLDGAIFDITVRRAAEQALREHVIVEAQLAEVRASRARILEAGDRARREIERNLHDGAQERFVSLALALTNVAKYARASRAWVNVERRDGHVDVEVGDDGVGGAHMGSGSGLQGLRDRIAALNGTLDIDSRLGTGTVVRARLPIQPSVDQ